MKNIITIKRIISIMIILICVAIILLSNFEAIKNRSKVLILWTSDVHCALDDTTVKYVNNLKNNYIKKGYRVILLDDGDFIYDDEISKEDDTRGEKYLLLMNELGYDIAIPGNSDLKFGMKQFNYLKEKANFKYICCNIFYKDKSFLDPYYIMKTRGKKIAFIGYTAPWNTTKHTEIFQDDDGNVYYSFLSGSDGEAAFSLLQNEINEVRNLGADYVYLFAHAGLYEDTEQDSTKVLIENTSGIDICVDAHTHDDEIHLYKNEIGEDTFRISIGCRFANIGYSLIDLKTTNIETGMWPVDINSDQEFPDL